jgi:hypothetical protein
MHLKSDLNFGARNADHCRSMSNNIPAEIRAWIECTSCGRIDKPTIAVQIPKDLATPKLEQVCFACECCGAHAIMYLQRAVKLRIHKPG